MKVIIYSIPTVNGLIAMEEEKDYGFISNNSWDLYLETLKNMGVFVMGGRTYEVSLGTGAFPYPDCLNVVMTSKKSINKWEDSVIFTDQGPREVLNMIAKKGFNEAVVTGGHLSTSFLENKLVDEIWVNLMPHIFTKGMNVFSGNQFESKLELLDNQQNTEGEVFLKYKVLK